MGVFFVVAVREISVTLLGVLQMIGFGVIVKRAIKVALLLHTTHRQSVPLLRQGSKEGTAS